MGRLSLNNSLGKLSFTQFKRFYTKSLKGKTELSVEELYESVGGKLPKKKK